MTIPEEQLARKIGGTDAMLFFVVWLCVGLRAAARPLDELLMIALLLSPPSALVGWRGTAWAKLILSGSASRRRAAVEGFAWGAAIALAFWLWGFSNAALAAGTVFDGLSPLQWEFWVAVTTTLIPVVTIVGSLGLLHGLGFFYFNRWLVRRWRVTVSGA